KVQERYRPSQHTFKKRLADLGYCVKHTNVGTAVYGLRIKPAWRPEWIKSNSELQATLSAAEAREVLIEALRTGAPDVLLEAIRAAKAARNAELDAKAAREYEDLL